MRFLESLSSALCPFIVNGTRTEHGWVFKVVSYWNICSIWVGFGIHGKLTLSARNLSRLSCFCVITKELVISADMPARRLAPQQSRK